MTERKAILKKNKDNYYHIVLEIIRQQDYLLNKGYELSQMVVLLSSKHKKILTSDLDCSVIKKFTFRGSLSVECDDIEGESPVVLLDLRYE